jgi:hypothetical protein
MGGNDPPMIYFVRTYRETIFAVERNFQTSSA